MRPFFVILVFLAVLVPAVAHAKRGPKPKVDPVDYQGVRYTPHGDGRTQYVQALDIKTGKPLWDVAVFSTTIIPLLEEDVQWVFIKQMFIDDARLIVVAEDDRAYSLDLKTGAVKKLKHAPTQKTQANKSLQATRDGGSSSASRFTLVGPACLSSRR
jgi:outer membrane protein assembly factor BamB